MRFRIPAGALMALVCLTLVPPAFGSEVEYAPDGHVIHTVRAAETQPLSAPQPEEPVMMTLGFEASPLGRATAEIEEVVHAAPELSEEEKRYVQTMTVAIEGRVVDAQPAIERIADFMKPVRDSGRIIASKDEDRSTQEVTLTKRVIGPVISGPEQNQTVADFAGLERSLTFPELITASFETAVLFLKSKIEDVKEKVDQETMMPGNLVAAMELTPDLLQKPEPPMPETGESQVLESVTLDGALAAIHYFLNPPKDMHPLHRILFYLSHVDSNDLRRYEETRRKIEDINREAKDTALKVRYMGQEFESGFMPLLDDGRGARLELIAQK